MASGQGGKLKLVVATNFSKKSEMALDFALNYSHNTNADVYLFHVFEGRSNDFREADRQNIELMDRMKNAVMQAIQRQGGKHSIDQVHRRMSHGKAQAEIFTIASGIRADMIIMGAPTSKNFKDVSTHSPCTLVLVKEQDFES